jgi:hypothetical protein
MKTTKQELGLIAGLVIAIGALLVLVTHETEPRWCTPDKPGVAALEAEVFRYVSEAHWRDTTAPLIDESGVRAGLLAECGR